MNIDTQHLTELQDLLNYWKKEFEVKILPKYLNSLDNCSYCGITVYDISLHKQFTGITPPLSQEKTIDHIIPKSKGGLNTSDNLAIVCRKCNTLKGNK